MNAAREIKFRVWVETVDGLRFMVYPKMISFGGSGSLSWVTTKEDELIKDNGYCKERTPMQYTGLTDRHGKEVYEGDVLRMVAGLEGVVEYDPACFVAKGQLLGKPFCSMSEVIGNVYENPELLK